MAARTTYFFFFFQAEDGIRDLIVTGVRRVLFRSSPGRESLQVLLYDLQGKHRYSAQSLRTTQSPTGRSAEGNVRRQTRPGSNTDPEWYDRQSRREAHRSLRRQRRRLDETRIPRTQPPTSHRRTENACRNVPRERGQGYENFRICPSHGANAV